MTVVCAGKKQTEESINKAIKLRNLFKILTCTNNGPSVDSLCIIYKALIRSGLEYGTIPYGCANQNQQKRIETVQNSILRMILGAPTSTPIKELQCELGLNSIESRRSCLTGRYVIRIDKQPQHPLYKICQEMRRSPKSWKDHNMPSLNPAIALTDVGDIKLFYKPAGYKSQLQELAPWKDHNINTGYFPMSKKKQTQTTQQQELYFLKFSTLSKMRRKSTLTDHLTP